MGVTEEEAYNFTDIYHDSINSNIKEA